MCFGIMAMQIGELVPAGPPAEQAHLSGPLIFELRVKQVVLAPLELTGALRPALLERAREQTRMNRESS